MGPAGDPSAADRRNMAVVQKGALAPSQRDAVSAVDSSDATWTMSGEEAATQSNRTALGIVRGIPKIVRGASGPGSRSATVIS
jgi:alpha-D-ribose 1-methylphosphonate 5-triphosphate diphosphatase PhnM